MSTTTNPAKDKQNKFRAMHAMWWRWIGPKLPVVLLSILIVYALFPMVWVVLTAFKPENEIVTANLMYLPQNPTFENFDRMWRRSNFPSLMANSLVVTLMTVSMCLSLATLAAYSISRYRFRGRNALLLTYLSIRMFPFVLMLIPAFIILRDLGLLDTRFGLALAYTTFSLPIAVWFMKNFFDAVPSEIEDAARIDGCSRMMVLLRIMLPLTLPGLAATAVLVGIGAWNEYLFALMLTTSGGSRTWPVGVQLMVGDFQLPFGQLAAAGVLTITPIIIAYVIAGRRMVEGLMAGGVKG
jgi:multiple sugar transport system permease protein